MARVLIVETDPDIVSALSETLTTCIGCNIDTADNAAGCWKVIEKDAPDVILVDASLPDMEGFEICKTLKMSERTRHIPVILLTSGADDIRSRMRGMEIGADDYLVQPVDNLELVSRFKILLKLKRLMDAAREDGDSFSRLSPKTAHKLRSPLNSIIGMAELIQKPFYGALTEKQMEFAQIISRSGHQLLDCINELADD